jgi:hypothetical protein
MGSIAHVFFDGYPLFYSKNDYYSEIVKILFLPEDYVEESRPLKSRSEMIWGDAYAQKNGNYLFRGFRQKAQICRARLGLFGHTVHKAKVNFVDAKKFAQNEGYYGFPVGKVTFQNYLNTVKQILWDKEIHYDELYTNLRESLISDGLFLQGQNLEDALASILSILNDEAVIEYDLSDLIEAGWIKAEEVVGFIHEKIIVLTEGKTDVEFITKSLTKLYPALFPYYHFINFDEYKLESNASALVKIVTAFAASNVKHPIIVLFDNDTSGLMEMKKLSSITLPNNIKVLCYPTLKSKIKYPTIGPTGMKNMNINGRACSIEMYFGNDVLQINSKLIPVIWKGYNESVKKYQGEIQNKKYVQEAIRAKLNSLTGEFNDIHLLLKAVFDAYK